MSERTNYTFTVLRYVHDITTCEFVNVGVVLHAPKAKFLRAKMRETYDRISRFFPGAHGEHIKRVMTTEHIGNDLFRRNQVLPMCPKAHTEIKYLHSVICRPNGSPPKTQLKRKDLRFRGIDSQDLKWSRGSSTTSGSSPWVIYENSSRPPPTLMETGP
jgi:hypothetical protein